MGSDYETVLECLGRNNDEKFIHTEYAMRQYYFYVEKETQVRLFAVAPDHIIKWICPLFSAVAYVQGFKDDRPIQLHVIPSKFDTYKEGIVDNFIGFYVHGVHQILIFISKAMNGHFKQAKPLEMVSPSVAGMIEVLWHELCHANPDCDIEFADQAIVEQIIEAYWGILNYLDAQEEGDTNA